jgi:7,8-dihydropterin-6-yl-methyl-4-(beta-D-ribofuranosyl)aminobenzene 5'-phosphate synthase
MFTQNGNALKVADQVEVQVLVDNVTDQLSSNPAGVLSEFDCLRRAGMTMWGGDTICCAHFGLSLVITAYANGRQHTVLFDAGSEGSAVERNGKRLGIDFGAIDGVVLSHGHWDHAGGLPTALQLIHAHAHGREVPLYAHPGMFRPRGDKLPDGSVLPSRDIPSIESLTKAGAAVVCTAEPQLLAEDCFYVSGEIPRVTFYEKGLPGHMSKMEDGADWEPDPLIMDERFLAVKVRDKGIVVFTACSH